MFNVAFSMNVINGYPAVWDPWTLGVLPKSNYWSWKAEDQVLEYGKFADG